MEGWGLILDVSVTVIDDIMVKRRKREVLKKIGK